MSSIRILLIEDNPGDARLISELLKDADTLNRSHQVHHVERVGDAVELLRGDHAFDIILSDITLPDSRGLATFDALQRASGDVPVLFMTGSNDEELAVAAINKGAQDYLVKGRFSGDTLARAIHYAIERGKFRTEMHRAIASAEKEKQRAELLSEQKQQLIDLNHAKDEFISLASHQLRTPATAVKQYIGMLLEGYAGDIPESHMPFLQTAYDSNEQQLTIINELLKTARIDSNTYRVRPEKQNIVQLVERVVKDLAPIIRFRNQEIAVTSQDDCCDVAVDPDEIRLVLANVIENASKYSRKGKKITIRLSHTKKQFRIAVRDQGVGIPAEHQSRIFEKFTRIDNALSDTVDGTGLGLYWALRIMRLHGGDITVASAPGKGSTFTLVLPLDS